jgi:hypothetical protein
MRKSTELIIEAPFEPFIGCTGATLLRSQEECTSTVYALQAETLSYIERTVLLVASDF